MRSGRMPMIFACFWIAACSTQSPAPIAERSINVESAVREPAAADRAGLQIKPLQPPGVRELLVRADAAEQAGDYRQAAVYLERALRMQPDDPELLQRMAELHLARSRYEQALNYAARSYDTGPKLGELCSRNWHTIAVARDALEDTAGASEARSRAGQCAVRPPPRY